MNAKTLIRTLLAATFVGLLTVTAIAKDTEKELEAKAKITRAEAEKTALEKVPGGTVKEGELEEEHGKLIWSFDISVEGSKNIREIQVDAITGKLVSDETETPKDEAKEAKKEAKEKKHKKHKKEKDEDDDDKDEKK